jgi:ribosomal protein L29
MMRYEIRVPEPEQLEQQLEQLKYQQQQARKQRDGAGT